MPILLTLLLALALTAQADSAPIQRMAATERAFAAAAAEVGVRDAFLTFLADDAIQIRGASTGSAVRVIPARAEVASDPLVKLPLATRLMWEPFTGQVSDDGTLGWLTGGYANLEIPMKMLLGQGAYFRVWERTDAGTWRVWLDEGIALPDVWREATSFHAAQVPDASTVGEAGETLEVVEREVAKGGAAWGSRLSVSVRLHRQGRLPIVGREAALEWARATWASITSSVATTRVAGSDDLGVALGGYEATTTGGGREHGTWVRVWKRDVTGRWRVVFETSRRR